MINVMSPQDALIATMMITSAADSEISEKELKAIGAVVSLLPPFEGYDRDRIEVVWRAIADVLQAEDGVDATIGLIKGALPGHLRETAYALACDVAAADGQVQLEEMRLLELLRHALGVDRLNAAAIERGARARHTRVNWPLDD